MMTWKLARVLALSLFVFASISLASAAEDADAAPEDVSEQHPAEETSQDETEASETTESDVIDLKEANFDETIQSNDIILVEFYAPWCGHCKALAPAYEKAATILKENDPPVALAKVDATLEQDLASRFGVSGYPTLKVFKNGDPFDYDGPRDEDGIVSYMKERADPNWKPPPEAVITLDKDTFAERINNEEIILVEFYAPWCGHCKQLAPQYEKAAQRLQKEDPPIPLAKVDATKEADLAKEYDVSGYPTLMIFRKGTKYSYDGPRDERGIVNYMQKQSGPASKELRFPKEVTSYINQGIAVVLGAFDMSSTSRFYDTYVEASNRLRDEFPLAHTFIPEAYAKYGHGIVVIQPEKFQSKYEPKFRFLGGYESADDVVEFVEKHALPLVGEFTSQTRKYYDKSKPTLVAFYTVDWSFDHKADTQFWRSKILNVANDYPDIKFAIANDEEFESELKLFQLDDFGGDVAVGIYGKETNRYKMTEEDFDEDALRDFVDAFKGGELTAIVRSQPAPKHNTGPVTVVVGKTFHKIVMDKRKDVLIEFYAPWCGHCKQLEPKYKQLAKRYKENKDVVIAKLDATANDFPSQFKVEGFPTIFFVPRGDSQEPVKYEGGREVDDFVKFLDGKVKGKEEL